MLQIKGAEPHTFRLLKDLMALPPLGNFHLCGGTALALHFGHRLSVDIDLFTPDPFDKQEIAAFLSEQFPAFKEVFTPVKSFYFSYLNNIKVDFVHNKNKVISGFEMHDEIRFWGIRDIIAMKLNAIYGRGSKKDFWDLDEILERYSLSDISEWFFEKHPNAFEEGLFMSLVYFDDAEKGNDPVCLKGKNWTSIKRRIEKEVKNYFRQ
jgi:Nucleotidyl transferase AbiEii toxin, Type IV TA system